MSVWMSLANNFMLETIEFCTYLILAETFFDGKRRGFVKAGISILFFVVNYVLAEVCSSVLLRELAIILMLTLMTKFLYQAKLFPCLFTATLYMALLNLSDVIILYAFVMFSGQSLTDLQSSTILYTMASYLAKILALLVIAVAYAWGIAYFKHRPQVIGNYVKFGIYPLSTLVSALLMYHAAIQAPQIASILLFCVVFLLVTDVLTIFLMRQFEYQQEELNNSYILHRQLGIAMDNIVAATQSYENERKLTHDFQNQLVVIRGMLESSADRREIIAYLDQTANYTSSSSLSISTNRSAVDVLLNQKYAVSRKKEIDFQVRLDDLSGFPLPDNAFVVLLSNLLDNAIDACDKIADGKEKSVLIKMNVGNDECLLSVENTVSGPVLIENNRIQTTKAEQTKHGYGMININSIVDTYNGYCTMKCDGKTFCFAATFPGAQSEKL